MDESPLLRKAPADPSPSPPLSPCPAHIDEDAKNMGGIQEPVSGPSSDCKSKKGAQEAEKKAKVSPAGNKDERKAGFRRWVLPLLVGGRGRTAAGAGNGSSSGGNGAAGRVPILWSGGSGNGAAGRVPIVWSGGSGTGARKHEHVVDIDSPCSSTSPATTAAGVVEAEAGRSFPSRVLAAPLSPETEDKLNRLIGRAEVFAGRWSEYRILANPAADMAAALRNFAAAQNAATSAGLREAAAALAKVAGSGKLEDEAAVVAKFLVYEAAVLAGGARRADSTSDLAISTSSAYNCSSRNPEVLYYIAIPGSVGLLPYLNTTIPADLQVFVAILFGTVFSGATAGAFLTARGRDDTDLQTASIVGALSFTAFSVLVIVFVACALAGGNIVVVFVLAFFLLAVHLWAWVKKK